jgi:2-iminobutanoate/2-iminopropanoate deaminase
MTVERILGPVSSTYSDAVVADGQGRFVFVSGQLPLDADGAIVGQTLGEQAEVCFDHVERVLGAASAGLADVVRITAFLSALDDYAQYSEVRSRRFGGAFPASTAVQVAGLLAGALIEIDAVAFVAPGGADDQAGRA